MTESLELVTLECGEYRVVVCPDAGAKITSIQDPDGAELLWHDDRPIRTRRYGDDYAVQNHGGWDECFPTIAPCLYPFHPWEGVELPDHGELWTQPWHWERVEEGIHTWVYGVRFSYRFDRWVRSHPDRGLRIEYRLENLVPYSQMGLWSAHALFAAEADTQVLLPESTQVRTDYSAHDRLAIGSSYYKWPEITAATGERVDLSSFPGRDAQRAEKLFSSRLKHGWTALYHSHSRRYMALAWNTADVPYVGIWLNAGGWPEDHADYHIGLEPCTGYPDRLDVGAVSGDCTLLAPHETRQWVVDLWSGHAESVTQLRQTADEAAEL